ncbi:hypothetical protein [Bacillus sp. EB600]|uniref:hypothetical protein n=1 Tax=Bacillus sp. EB600 TaxID=2806345 RepID=UPI002109C25A|nr:hypothetical protein [Bacillus sp. EB600]MCQ6280883.1 hypothetical protein [Bacillus sp. EB600]
MEEVSLEEFISSLDPSYRAVFDLLEDKTLINFAKSIIPIMKDKGITAETILFDEEIKDQIDTIIDGNADKLLAIETLLKGLEYLESSLESFKSKESISKLEDTAPKMVTYYMIHYILSKKSNKNIL